jgi:hypothetical protein
MCPFHTQTHDFDNVLKFYLIFLNGFWIKSYNIRKPLRNEQVVLLFNLLSCTGKTKTAEAKDLRQSGGLQSISRRSMTLLPPSRGGFALTKLKRTLMI